jgi:hypothetical protein
LEGVETRGKYVSLLFFKAEEMGEHEPVLSSLMLSAFKYHKSFDS